jgi:integrase
MDENDPNITLTDYITAYWIPVMRQRVEENTATSYEQCASQHIPESLKQLPIVSIRRGHLKRMLSDLCASGKLAPATVAKIANVVRSIFNAAHDDELIPSNPAEKLGRALGLKGFLVDKLKAMEGDQLALFLVVAREKEPAHYVELAMLAYTGLRIGELRGLQTDDVDLPRRTIMVTRQVLENGIVKGPKGRRGKRKTRAVDVADELAGILELLISSRREFNLRMRLHSHWLLYPDFSDPPTGGEVSTVTHRLRRAMKRVLELANLPGYFTPHSLRHTYATLLLQRGEDLAYVSRQIGDTLAMTFELYGRHARVPARAGGPNLIAKDPGELLQKR